MTDRFTLAALALAVLGLFAAAAGPTAQFETPNRAFHNATSFRLDGRHQSVPCASCHVNGQYAGTPTTCYQCHWIRRKDDRYQTRLGSECESCHRPTSWTAATFNHAAISGVALGTNHRALSCDSCHKDAQFAGATAECISCHRRDFEATKSPDHLAAGFPATCDSCHRPNDGVWQNAGGSGFAHAAVFPLVGRHASATCQSCHRNSVYKGTARDCAGCHTADYNRTQNPSHVAAGFPTTCETCHRATDSAWTQGRFTHTQFPLTSRHNVPCAQCHTTAANFRVFSCTVCHARGEMDSKHRGRGGYIYDSNACYSCHPNGRS